MSTYVFSDVHGHSRALDRALERVSPCADDRIFCLGDMVDRGPDPVGVMRIVRSLPGVVALMGNHESLMASCVADPDDALAALNWGINGGNATSEALRALPGDQARELVDWAVGLPRAAATRVGERTFLLCHAGVRLSVPVPDAWDEESARAYLAAQDPEDLLWIREEFWGAPHGPAGPDADGERCPVVVCGHTPTPYLERMGARLDEPVLDYAGRARMARVGADRWDVDCAAAAGEGVGQVLVLRLDDGAETYEPVLEGE